MESAALSAKPARREWYLDNLKVFLTVLVISIMPGRPTAAATDGYISLHWTNAPCGCGTSLRSMHRFSWGFTSLFRATSSRPATTDTAFGDSCPSSCFIWVFP